MKENNIVSLRDISVDFDGDPILVGLDLDIRDKEFVTLLGAVRLWKNHNAQDDWRFRQSEVG